MNNQEMEEQRIFRRELNAYARELWKVLYNNESLKIQKFINEMEVEDLAEAKIKLQKFLMKL
ncbi:MAG: hypothetical protein WCQ96_02945 [Patescibacteria group bacterium]